MKKMLLAAVITSTITFFGCRKQELVQDETSPIAIQGTANKKIESLKQKFVQLQKTNTRGEQGTLGSYYFGRPTDAGQGNISCQSAGAAYCHDAVFNQELFTLHDNMASSVSYIDENLVFNQMVTLSDLSAEKRETIIQNGYFEVLLTDAVEQKLINNAYEEAELAPPSGQIYFTPGQYHFDPVAAPENPESICVMNICFDPANGIKVILFYM
jgi:hypothetical protein